MDCKFTEQLSLLIDGELNDDAARQVRLHVSACAICQQAQEDFLLLRQEIQAYQHEPDVKAQQRAIENILHLERTPFWRKKVALPVPAFALLMLALVAVSLWAISFRTALSPQPTVKTQPANRPGKIQTPANAFDMSRFDKGERAVIYTTRHAQTNEVKQ